MKTKLLVIFLSIMILVIINVGVTANSLDLMFITGSIRAKINFLVEVPAEEIIEIEKLELSIANLQLAKTMDGMEKDPKFSGWLKSLSALNAEVEVSRNGLLPTSQINIRITVSVIAAFVLVFSSFLVYVEVKENKQDDDENPSFESITSKPGASNPRAIKKTIPIS